MPHTPGEMPAFPQPQCPQCGTDHQPHMDQGLTLRDYFAAKLAAAMVSNSYTTKLLHEMNHEAALAGKTIDKIHSEQRAMFANAAYGLADAMIAARNANPQA